MRSACLVLVLLVSSCASLAAHAAERPLRVGVDESWPPHQFVDSRGRPTGFDVELFEAVARAEGLSYELIVDDWPTLRAEIEAGRLDVVPGAFATAARETVMDFSVPTVWVHHTLFVPDASEVDDLTSLQHGARVLIA